ncbi:phage integrase N-terminal SAM-like domain-containing protein [Desulfopila sp. IMCC35008]|uniref:phage integrase N-terminal SAM-like domain-containing protein n=1 Tax=Desulfopila sp. IMCC35008 TaxID=2653858 RepID=UPI001F0F17ED|nr:phage integrase N-terminal SAM-like domain-containing protein [Desulfopila sp. IMCC35008]
MLVFKYRSPGGATELFIILSDLKLSVAMGFDENGFVNYLLYDVLVRKGTEVYYTYWVKQFLREYDADGLGWQQQLDSFLKKLRVAGDFQEWQAGQAEKAVRTYFTGFKNQPEGESNQGDPGKPVEGRVLEVDTLLSSFRKMLRKQNCGASTEKMYLGWIEEYLRFQLKIDPEKATFSKKELEQGVSSYIRFLETERQVSSSVRKQAFTAILIFFSLVLNQDISKLKYLLEQ